MTHEALPKTAANLAHSPEIATLTSALAPSAALHLVGGAVREILSSQSPTDLDLATVLRPEEVERRLNQHQIRTIETGIEHGTIMALVGDRSIEITTFRLPSPRSSSRFSDSIETDLGGRDFTINALAIDLETNTLIDPFGGLSDLKRNILRAVGKAHDRFTEDPLRILRMIRFGPAAGREIVDDTLRSARATLPALGTVSPERIRSELEKILISAHVRPAFAMLYDLGIIELILPEMLPTVGFSQNEFHTEDVFAHTLTVLEAAPPSLALRLAALFHDLGKPATLSTDSDGRRHFYKHEEISEELARTAMTRLKFSSDLIDQVALLVRHHMRPLDCGPAGVRRIMRTLSENFENWRAFKIADSPPVMPKAEFQALLANFDAMVDIERTRAKGSVYGKLAVNGDDLIALGMSPGRGIGAILNELTEVVIEDPERNDREFLLARAQELVQKMSDGQGKN